MTVPFVTVASAGWMLFTRNVAAVGSGSTVRLPLDESFAEAIV
jgi:hypothetical protein